MQAIAHAVALAVLAAASSGAAKPHAHAKHRTIVLGTGGDWVSIDVVTRAHERIELPEGVRPLDLGLSPDQRVVTYIARLPGHPSQARLFVWDRDPAVAPRQIGDARGYYSDCSFSPDGRWIYFAHNANGYGTALRHTKGAFAQLYRIHPDGTGLTQLTTEDGCHFSPTLNAKGQLTYVHAACVNPSETIELRPSPSQAPVDVYTVAANMDGLQLRPDGQAVLYTTAGNNTISISEFSLKDKTTRTLTMFLRTTEKAHPTYGDSAREIYFVRRGAVWLFSGATTQQLFTLSRKPKP